MTQHNCSLIIVSVTFAILSGCGRQGPVERSWGRMKGLEKIVGNMQDTSYSMGKIQKPRPNALGRPVAMTHFAGSFVWAEYAAPWCGPCTRQATEIKAVEKQAEGDVVFITIMTSRSNQYNDHATVDTAKSWASRFGLDPKRVLAAELWSKTIPEHRLYSPQGHTLFVHVGGLSAKQITEILSYYKIGYSNWSETGEPAEWMTSR